MPSPTLGSAVDGGAPVTISMSDLIGTDVCAIAKKGFGKSGLLRVLFEQTYGLIQQIILDPEDEFYTLREAGDYLVAGGDTGDCPATLANARALAKMLMENPGISAVIQLGHLEADVQEDFVALFLTEVMSTKRTHWHPVLLCLDETQRFAPQDQRVSSSDVVKDLVRRGRKRGITPVFASLSHSAINKDVTRGVSTWLFGRVGTDIDRKVVANSLALPSSSPEARDLPFLPQRRFWAFGHPVSDRPVLFDVADAQTTIVKSGGALVAMPPPPKSLQKLLEALSKAAAPETPEPVAPAAGAAPLPDLDAIRKEAAQAAYQQGVDLGMTAGHRQGAVEALQALQAWLDSQKEALQDGRMIDVAVDDRDNVGVIGRLNGDGTIDPSPLRPEDLSAAVEGPAKLVRQPRAAPAEDGPIVITEALQRVLDTLRWWTDRGRPTVSRQRACVMAGYSPKASTFGVYVGKLMKADLIEIPSPGNLQITAAGYALANRTSPGLMLTDAASQLLSGKPREVFDILVEVGPSGISRHVLADRLGLSRKASTLGVYIGKVSALGFVDIPRPGEIALADWLRA